MVVKTFNVNPKVYGEFVDFCKRHGISASKQIEIFMRAQLEEKEKVRKEYLKTLEVIRKGKFIRVKDLNDIL
jgi:hypothetical protein